jgi:DNA-binding transcriptional LysR family regulator
MNVNYDWYRIFYYVAQNKNITSAAEQLFISQPAVSQCIKNLEKAFGCRLLIRTPKGVHMTAEGQTLFSHMSKGIDQIKIGEKKLLSLINMEAGEIHIGASDMTLEFFLLPYLEQFHQRYPQIKIHITNGPTPETIKILGEEKIDFGVVSEPVLVNREYKTTPVKEIEDIFICSRDFYEKVKISSLEELVSYPLIMLEKNTSTRDYIDSYFAGNNILISPEFELATSRLIVQFVKRNLGIGSVVRDFATEELKNGEVVELHLMNPPPKRNICIVQKNTASKAAEKLLELILI